MFHDCIPQLEKIHNIRDGGAGAKTDGFDGQENGSHDGPGDNRDDNEKDGGLGSLDAADSGQLCQGF